MHNYFLKLYRNVMLVMSLAALSGCSDTISDLTSAKEIAEGEPVLFTTLVPDLSATTRSAKSEWQNQVNAYRPMPRDYRLNIEMYKCSEGGAPIKEGTAVTYKRLNEASDIDDQDSGYDGTLQPQDENKLYWPDNHNKWGFMATAGREILQADQSTSNNWLNQDKLIGYSYLPIWDGGDDDGRAVDSFDNINFRTSKEWYAGNKALMDAAGVMPSSNDEYKKIPLYLQHQRAWITVVLRAGEGVAREALQYSTSAEKIQMNINSFADGSSEALAITPWSREHFIDYAEDKNGGAQTHVSTTRYDAIVMPHNYATKKDEEKIAMINLSGQKFSFYAGNDSRYLAGSSHNPEAANNDYNLEAGKHLTIEATLSRESRKILITAWIEDWTEVATQTICDDYGQNGDPEVIKSKAELIAFLSGNKNKQGNVGIIQPTELDLDAGQDWTGEYDLKATLNLAGCVFKTKHRLFKDMDASANLVNGTVLIGDDATVECAIANTNNGTIERVNVSTSSELSTAKATVAGLVKENHGTIYQCTSTLTVSGTTGYNVTDGTTKYIGGIAAISTSPDGSMAVIDGCTVNASVNGTNSIYGGGIVGYVTGRVSNNIFEYGITVSQKGTNYKNIFAQTAGSSSAGTSSAVRAYGNGWPTKVLNPVDSEATNVNTYADPENLFDAVFDSQAELDEIMKSSTYNASGKVCRISKSFSVASTSDDATDWTHGTVAATDRSAGVNNVSFTLDGNGKTITLTGTKSVKTTTGKNLGEGVETSYTTAPMLFNFILGEVKDLTIYLDKSLVASPSEATNQQSEKVYNAEDAIAPLAYAVWGENAKLTNVNVKARKATSADSNDGAYVQASTAAGLVVWAYGGATITNCKVNVPVRMWLPTDMGNDAKHYSGGIVGVAAKATIIQCWYLGNAETSVSGSDYSLSAKKSANYYYGGIVGGTSQKESETPELSIHDCTSWFNATPSADESEDKSSKGGIIGYCCYAENGSASTVMSGMKEGNEGNWWQLSAVGASYWLPSLTEEKVIGKRNGVNPTYNDNF